MLSLSEWGGFNVYKYLIFNIPHYDLIEPKLPKNINMCYKRKKTWFDNTNYNNIDTRY